MVNFVDNSPPGFIDQLCERIEPLLSASYWQKAEFGDEEYRSPKIFKQYLPVVKTEKERDAIYPYVLVVCSKGNIADFTRALISSVNVSVFFGGFDNEEERQGWATPMSMLWAVIQKLLANKTVGSYILDAPVSWETIHSENPPYYFARLDLIFKGGAPAIEVPNEAVSLGDNNNLEG